MNSDEVLNHIFPASSVKVTPKKRAFDYIDTHQPQVLTNHPSIDQPIPFPPQLAYTPDTSLFPDCNQLPSFSPLDELDNLLSVSDNELIGNTEELEIKNSSDLMDVIDSLTS